MSITEQLRAAVRASNDLDRQLARQIGDHIDSQARGLAALLTMTEAQAFAPKAFRQLPAATIDQFKVLKVAELKAIATRMQLPGRSKYTRKSDIIAFLVKNNAPIAPSYEQLLSFWVSQSQ